MRVFTAITLSAAQKQQLGDICASLRANCSHGRFTPTDNFHLTLVFLGELPPTKLSAVKAAMEKAAACTAPFTLQFGGCGVFRRDGGDIYWVGAKQSQPLQALHRALNDALRASGLPNETRPLTAHLTLGREVVPAEGFDRAAFSKEIPDFSVSVDSFSLMRSDRINGQMRYTPMHTVRLVKDAQNG